MNLYYRLHPMPIYHRETMAVTSINSELVDNGESLSFHALFEENFGSNPGWYLVAGDANVLLIILVRKLRKTMAKMNEITEVTRFGSHLCRNCFVAVRAGKYQGPLGEGNWRLNTLKKREDTFLFYDFI
ncbi:hypothetical protein CEXT_300231 [Caerostris extrusa]|uniref:Uncharacterized protein n=1 Tax=Caerostris extrusa TaxID=172846 RepID=A0AAV4VZ93_CAEEX|nr:hypothetical protein CEXT_300231 [Caerostris extrusa]